VISGANREVGGGLRSEGSLGKGLASSFASSHDAERQLEDSWAPASFGR
jgi:hypothetical protein